MLYVRRVATVALMAAALGVLGCGLYLFWQASHEPAAPALLATVRRTEAALMVLLGISGIYPLILILTADFNARAIERRLEHAKPQPPPLLQSQLDPVLERLERLETELRRLVESQRTAPPAKPDLSGIADRLERLSESQSLEDGHEILQLEDALAVMEILHPQQDDPALARIYRILARYYGGRIPARSHVYRRRLFALDPHDFANANELGTAALRETPPDYNKARKYFDASIAAEPNQQRAYSGLAQAARAEGDAVRAQALLETALTMPNWETQPDEAAAARLHYELACLLARRAETAVQTQRGTYFVRATEELERALSVHARQLEQMLLNDTEEGGDLYALATTPPYKRIIDDLLLSVSVGVG